MTRVLSTIGVASLWVLLAGAAPAAASEPALPAGLAPPPTGPSAEDPALPSGLGAGADETAEAAEAPTFLERLNDAGVRGFLEARGGVRTRSDPYEKDASIGEARLQLQYRRSEDGVRIGVTGDLIYDAVDDDREIDLRRGRGWFDLREAWAAFSPVAWMDVKLGRQVLTWGTGDLLFVNDRFPKDWQAFFLGRDVEYLKAPSDAVKVSAFADWGAVDLVYIPLMNPSRFLSGRRLSYYHPTLGRLAGRDAVIDDDLPGRWFADAEYAVRLSRRLGSYELAAYGFWGYAKTPDGFDPARGKAVYPRLDSYGASLRGPAGRGIANVEAAYYDSRDDRDGTDPWTPNSQVRLLAGYEMDLPEIARDLTVGAQYYVELMMDHGAYRRSLPAGARAADGDRHVVTGRITKLLYNQTLAVSLFAYYSPSDHDAYLRPAVAYEIDDHWSVEVGGNVFLGEDDHTFFGQLQDNSNVYAALRWAF